MPQDTRGRSEADTALPEDGQRLCADAAKAEELAPTLVELLQAFEADAGLDDEDAADGEARGHWRAALRATRGSTAPLDTAGTDPLATEILRAIRRELGDSAGDLASRSLEKRPLTRQMLARVLETAVGAAGARKTALASIAHARRGSDGKPLRPDTQGRDLRLLQCCLELVQEHRPGLADARALWQAAERLHDDVRTFLERQGRWPPTGAHAFEEHVRPAALVLVSWSAREQD